MIFDRERECQQLSSALEEAEQRGIRNPKYVAFTQTWGSTALGFNAAGASAMTPAQTCVVYQGNRALLYFGGRFACELDRELADVYVQLKRFPSVKEIEEAQERLEDRLSKD